MMTDGWSSSSSKRDVSRFTILVNTLPTLPGNVHIYRGPNNFTPLVNIHFIENLLKE